MIRGLILTVSLVGASSGLAKMTWGDYSCETYASAVEGRQSRGLVQSLEAWMVGYINALEDLHGKRLLEGPRNKEETLINGLRVPIYGYCDQYPKRDLRKAVKSLFVYN